MNETTLEKFLQSEQQIPLSLAISILGQCVDLLGTAHEAGRTYKHVTPGHIFISEAMSAETVQVELREPGPELPAQDNPMFGLAAPSYAAYMSPEEITGTTPDARSEEFSLAIIGYELLTGLRPFRAGNVSSLFYDICTQDAVPVNQVNRKLTTATAAVLERALAKDPTQRFSTPREFVQRLEETAGKESSDLRSLPAAMVQSAAATGNLAGETVGQSVGTQMLSSRTPEVNAAVVGVENGRIESLHNHGAGTEHAPPFELPPARRRVAYDDPEPESRRSTRALSPVQKIGLIAICCAAALAITVRLVPWRPKPSIPVQQLDTTSGPVTPPPPQQESSPQAQPAPENDTASSAQSLPKATPPPAAPTPNSQTVPQVLTPAPRFNSEAATQPLAGADVRERVRPAGSANVDLLTQPPGAQVEVDHRPDMMCVSPCTLMLSPGRHVLSASLEGFTPAQRIFHIPEDSSMMIMLSQGQGALLVTSVPTGALIMLDGKEVGRTPLSLHVKAGPHHLDGFYGERVKQQIVNVQPDSIQGANFDLR